MGGRTAREAGTRGYVGAMRDLRLGPPGNPPDKPSEKGSPGADVKERVEKPKMWRVLLFNDDYTTMEFVIEVLMEVFRKTMPEATRVMLTVHRSGKGVAGVYTREVAETKATQATDRARTAGYPLLVTTEPEPEQ
jgi:ATP-dependent Clp protease adaptor protein ClpS